MVGVHQVNASEYNRAGRERTPRGRSQSSPALCFIANGTTAHGQRERPHKGITRSSLTNLVAEGAGHDPASAPKDAAAYKAAPLPIRGNPPLSKSRCASKASVETGDRGQVRTGVWPRARKLPFQLGYPVSGLQSDCYTNSKPCESTSTVIVTAT